MSTVKLPDWRNEGTMALLALLAIAVIYLLLHQKYYIYYVDDAWFVSETWYFFQTGRIEDFLFRAPDAPDRVLLFGKTYFYVYGTFMQWFGWTKSNAILLSTIFIWLSAGVWYLILRQLGFSSTFQKVVALSMLVFPAYFNAANLTRPDAFVFFLSAITFLSFLKKQYFLSGFLLLVSLESHLMGSAAAFYITAWALYDWRNFFENKLRLAVSILFFCAGAALGAWYFMLLHPDFTFERLHTILSIKRDMNGFKAGLIAKYFVQQFWFRHVWELLLILVSIFLFVKNKLWKQRPFVAVFFVVVFLSSFAASRPNANYVVFFFPAFSILIFSTFEQLGKLKQLLYAAGTALLILYGAHFIRNYDYDFEMVNAETRASLPDPKLPVIGMPDNWFAVPERTFYPIYHSVKYIPELDIPEFYLVRNDYIGYRSKNYDEMIAYFEKNYNLTPIRQFNATKNKSVKIFHCKQKTSVQ